MSTPGESPSGHESSSESSVEGKLRLPAVDYVKAAAIVAVMVTHAIPGFFEGRLTPIRLFAFLLTGFNVPAFLFVSGFLSHAESPVGWRHVAERLRRVLPPYLVATVVVWMFGLVALPTLGKLVFTIVTGAALGHYYFVPILAFCFLLLPMLSRLSGPLLIATSVVLAILSEVMWLEPAWRLSGSFFWWIRDPFLQFHLGHFILGMIASRYRVELGRILTRHATPVAIAAGVGILAYAWSAMGLLAPDSLARTAYTLAVITFIAALTRARPAPAVVRFLSDATLTIYLYHWFAYNMAFPFLSSLPHGLPLIVLPALGLGFGSLVVVAGRRLFGKRSRLLLGA